MKRVTLFEPHPKLILELERRDLKNIRDLCTAFESYFPGAPSLNKRDGSKFTQGQLHLLTDFNQTTTLENLLVCNKQTQFGNEMQLSLSRRQRMCNATTLAISLLQLHRTPWLGERWSKKDILILLMQMGLSRADGGSGSSVRSTEVNL